MMSADAVSHGTNERSQGVHQIKLYLNNTYEGEICHNVSCVHIFYCPDLRLKIDSRSPECL